MNENEPVMDGAADDMSDSGTPKAEAQDLMESGKEAQIQPPDTGGLEEDPLANSNRDDHNDHTGV